METVAIADTGRGAPGGTGRHKQTQANRHTGARRHTFKQREKQAHPVTHKQRPYLRIVNADDNGLDKELFGDSLVEVEEEGLVEGRRFA